MTVPAIGQHIDCAILLAMPLPRHRHQAFEQNRVHEYPQHLRNAIQDAPSGAGVYTFHGQAGDLPLYIGKSVKIGRASCRDRV